MSLETWIEIAVAGFALLLLAAAGLVEASLLKNQRLTIRQLLDSGDTSPGADSTVDQATRTRMAVDIAALLAVLVLGAILARAGIREFGLPGLGLLLIVGALGVILVGRVVPNALVDRFSWAENYGSERLAPLLTGLVWPVTFTIDLLGASFARLFGETHARSEGGNGTNGQANGSHFENGEDPDYDRIQEDEHEMISGILRMEDASAREIMVPRPDVIAVPIEASVQEVVRIAQEAGHSRIPVYEDSIDRVQGIIYAKDLLRFVTDDESSFRISDLMRPAVFVPESKPVDDLLRDLRRSRVHMAVVVDEYGGTAGIVTIEDVLEEIVGEIQDEYDREVPLYDIAASGEITVDGRIGVDELADLIGVDLPETESETVGGFVQRQLGHIPEAGERVEAGQIAIEVEAVERRRVRTLRVSLLDEQASLESPDTVRVT